jgi:hypothetical protein
MMFLLSQELKSDDLIRIDNVDYNSKFFILRAKRIHNGKYTIIAKNSVGEDKVDFDIAVLGKYKETDSRVSANVMKVFLNKHLTTLLLKRLNR